MLSYCRTAKNPFNVILNVYGQLYRPFNHLILYRLLHQSSCELSMVGRGGLDLDAIATLVNQGSLLFVAL